jgi:dTDP-4-amino-4,6-dideoxygalactose transaminase
MMNRIIYLKNIVLYENLAISNKPYYEEFKSSFAKFLDSGWYVLGGKVAQFEQNFGKYIGTKYAIGVASGLDALVLGIESLHLPKGSEILVPSNTYIASINSIIMAGHIPVLVEPDINTYNIDAKLISDKITSKTSALMIVHLYGKSCDMKQIMKIVRQHNLLLIEDCAQAHGAMFENKKIGSFGHVSAFSFYPTKNLGALGDGGAVLTNSGLINDNVRMLRNYGSRVKYYNDEVGYNSRLDEIQAYFLDVKLKYLDKINNKKRELAQLYQNGLNDIFVKPIFSESHHDVFHIYNVRHHERDKLKKYMMENNIHTEIHYPIPPHKQKSMDNHLSGPYLISEEIHKTTLSLPISTMHSAEDVSRVIEIMNSYK